MKLIYISHPLVGDGSPVWGDRDNNVERALRFIAMATNQGHVVVSWVHHPLIKKKGYTRGDEEDPATFYLSRDYRLVSVSEELWVCGPPEKSAGTRFEIEAAREFGLPVVQKPEWMFFDFDPLAERCCERDHDGDGNCDIHAFPGIPRTLFNGSAP
jgi:hypothetical protein